MKNAVSHWRGARLLLRGHWLPKALGLCAAALACHPFDGTAAEANRPPSSPGAIAVTEVTATAAQISWVPATGPAGVTLVYDVDLRKRVEGAAQDWRPAKETAGTSAAVAGLDANTVYDVRVRAWAQGVAGPYAAREAAFRTLAGPPARAPTLPGEIQISEVGARSARVSWGAATDPDGDAVAYLLCLRKRIEGVAQGWSAPQDTRATTLVWEGLAAEGLYDVRVRATDGKLPSDWLIKENAFRSLPAGNGPGKPASITVTDITANSARIAWEPSTAPAGATVAYDLELRSRLEGVAQGWKAAGETTATFKRVDGLAPSTTYDVRVRAWAKGTAGAWTVRENAFRTLEAGQANRAPSLPGPIEIAEVTAKSARLAWGASTDPDGDRVAYLVSLRKRIEGVAQDWLAAEDTRATSLVWDGLAPSTVYDVRVRASDGKTFSNWVIKENAFTTTALGRLTGFVERPTTELPPADTRTMVVAWPATAAPTVLEVTEDLAAPNWAKYDGEVETDGNFRRVTLPADGRLRFFRVR